MKHDDPRYPEVIALKVPTDLAKEIRRQARADDRTVSGYLRRLLTTVVTQQTTRDSGQ